MDILHTWGSRKFGNVNRELSRMRRKLERLYAVNAPMQEIRVTSDAMNELLYREEMLWLKEGDRNTKYFHRKAVWRARKNKIK
jgi:hypothetical protein